MALSDQVLFLEGGQGGLELVSGTGSNTGGPFVAIQALTNTAISSITGQGLINLTGMTLPAQQVMYGSFQTITLTSGSCLLYRGAVLP